MRKVFFDEKLNSEFLSKGYVVADLISPKTLQQLKHFYQNNAPETIQGFHTTHFSKDFSYKKNVHDGIVQIVEPELKKHLPDYIPAFANFMIKEGSGNNPMPLHADWTYVEEDDDISLSVWIPLVDTQIENGCLGIIPFSQQLSHKIRGPRILQWEPPFAEMLINSMGKLLPITAGQAIIYNHRTLHYSSGNDTGIVRPAINVSMTPLQVPIIHYTIPEGEQQIHKYAVDDIDFFIYYNNFQVPEKGKLIEFVGPVPLLNERMHEFIQENKKSFLGKMISILKPKK